MTPDEFRELDTPGKAALDEKAIRVICDMERMEHGVLVPNPPEMLDETPPVMATIKLFGVQYEGDYRGESLPILFDTPEAAQAFLDLKPRRRHHEYRVDRDCEKPIANATIEPTEVLSEAEMMRVKTAAQTAKENKDANAKARQEFERAERAASDAVEWIMEDWRNARERMHHLAQVQATFDEYLELCGGNEHSARTFLCKAYSPTDVAEVLGDRGAEPEAEMAPPEEPAEVVDPGSPDEELPL